MLRNYELENLYYIYLDKHNTRLRRKRKIIFFETSADLTISFFFLPIASFNREFVDHVIPFMSIARINKKFHEVQDYINVFYYNDIAFIVTLLSMVKSKGK